MSLCESYGNITEDEKLNYLLSKKNFIDDHLHMYPMLKNNKVLQAIHQAISVDIEEVKRRMAEQVKKRKEQEALQGTIVEEDNEENAEEKENVVSAKINLEDELAKVKREKAELEKLKRSFKGMVAVSDGTRTVQVDREIFNCPVCRGVLRVRNGNDICVNCGLHFTQ